ncbi:MAG: MBL fold metallo-hydrolase [Deltaproteobacteria bacterium]|nr:MBL fold metallo-hydrolase [Deltaproteobacteria bacterium]MCW5803544.1 MBL fold metallo-hydrolase [Deltaproteobacteria bacterium]
MTWLGHATAVAELGRGRVVFDPFLRRRARKAGRVDAVLVTHSHVDHLNRWSLKAIDRDTHLVIPKGARHVVADLGFREVSEVEAGDQLAINGLEVTAVPTRHDHGRWSKRHEPIAVGYVVASDGVALHHAGDVDFSDHTIFDDIGKHHKLDAALLPIGGMMPVWWYRRRRALLDRGIHIDPDCALDIFERLGASALVPIHWGTVNLRLGPSSAPRRRLEQVATERNNDRVRILAHGQRLGLDEQPK